MKTTILAWLVLGLSLGAQTLPITLLNANTTKAIRIPPPLPAPPPRRTNMTPVVVSKKPVALASYLKPNVRFIQGPLPTIVKGGGFTPASELDLVMIGLCYKHNELTSYPNGEIGVADISDISIVAPAGFGVKLEYSENLEDWALLQTWGTYPEERQVGVTWVTPVDQYPRLFFRAYKY